HARTPWQLRVRGFARLWARRVVRRWAATAIAADADVRSDFGNCRGWRRAWQGASARRTRSQAGSVVLPLSLQGRSGDAWVSWSRRALAIAGLFSRLARRTRQGPCARHGRSEILRPGLAEREEGYLRHRYQARDAREACARNCRRLAASG